MKNPESLTDDEIDELLKMPHIACALDFGEPDERDVWDAEVEAADSPGPEWGA
ncbi:hypothetical protein ACIGKR_30080 [Rhodococcus qingshengii]|uniref:hypothetical protein n=1 Tax=Rhodococcus qingshengii TaxID=334542 RepID=UPI0037C4FD3F